MGLSGAKRQSSDLGAFPPRRECWLRLCHGEGKALCAATRIFKSCHVLAFYPWCHIWPSQIAQQNHDLKLRPSGGCKALPDCKEFGTEIWLTSNNKTNPTQTTIRQPKITPPQCDWLLVTPLSFLGSGCKWHPWVRFSYSPRIPRRPVCVLFPSSTDTNQVTGSTSF